MIVRDDKRVANRVLRTVLVACAVIGLLVLAGCSAAKRSVDPRQDHKLMMEAAAKFYVAEAAQDVEGVRKLVHDPTNILELPTSTPPPSDAQTAAVTWVWSGDRIVVRSDSDEATYTLNSVEASPNVVDLKDGTGATIDSLIMKKVSGAWRVDVAEVKKTSDARANSPEGQKETCWQNQADIEQAAATYKDDTGKFPATLAKLVPDYFDVLPTCPTTKAPYTLGTNGVVAPCKVHGHYPAQEAP